MKARTCIAPGVSQYCLTAGVLLYIAGHIIYAPLHYNPAVVRRRMPCHLLYSKAIQFYGSARR